MITIVGDGGGGAGALYDDHNVSCPVLYSAGGCGEKKF